MSAEIVIFAPRDAAWWSESLGRIELRIGLEDAMGCSGQGAQDNNVAALCAVPYVRAQLERISDETLRDSLREYGAWDAAELADRETNEQRILWLACCNLREQSAAGELS